jgi:HSP20 family protein
MVNKGNGKQKPSEGGIDLGLGGILKGLGNLVEKLGELSEAGEQISKTGEIRGSGQEVKGIYGFTVKVGLGDDKPRVEPFGNIRRDAKSGQTVVHEVREPVVDVLEEEDHVSVFAEMPGISAETVHIEIHDDVLTITAEQSGKKYRKEVLLPGRYDREKMQVTCNNGILEIKCKK